MQIIISIIAGFTISFIGALPLGNLNITAMRLAIGGNTLKAWQFSTSAVAVEMAYIIACLKGIDIVARYPLLYMSLQGLMVLALLILGIQSFIHLQKPASPPGNTKKIILVKNGYATGLAMSAINVLQIPYWTGWATVAYRNSWLTESTIFLFTLAAGTGTLLSMAIFIVAGKKFSSYLIKNGQLLNLILGIVFITIAIIQFIQILNHYPVNK